MRERRRHREGTTERVPSLRLFYALWPDDATRHELAALQAGLSGRLVDAANLHLTLAFLGNQPQASLALLERVMQSLPLQPFTLEIDAYGFFSKPRIAWVGPSSPPAALMSLQATLWQALLDQHVPLKPVAGFRPHVTLARDAERTDRELNEVIRWRVGRIALVESVALPGGVHYQLRAQRQC